MIWASYAQGLSLLLNTRRCTHYLNLLMDTSGLDPRELWQENADTFTGNLRLLLWGITAFFLIQEPPVFISDNQKNVVSCQIAHLQFCESDFWLRALGVENVWLWRSGKDNDLD